MAIFSILHVSIHPASIHKKLKALFRRRVPTFNPTHQKRERTTLAHKILVVDDEFSIRELLTDFLEGEGYEVIIAPDGRKAVDMATSENPDVILLDVTMPGIGGIEVCSELRAAESTCSVPIIMMTALQDHKNEALEAKADDFVCKPFDLEDLLIRVKSTLRIRNLAHSEDRMKAYMEELDKNRLGS